MDIRGFLTELKISVLNGEMTEYVLGNIDEFQAKTNDDGSISDTLNEIIFNGTDDDFEKAITEIETQLASDEKVDIAFLTKPNELEQLRQENAELKERQEMAEEALLALSDMLLNR